MRYVTAMLALQERCLYQLPFTVSYLIPARHRRFTFREQMPILCAAEGISISMKIWTEHLLLTQMNQRTTRLCSGITGSNSRRSTGNFATQCISCRLGQGLIPNSDFRTCRQLRRPRSVAAAIPTLRTSAGCWHSKQQDLCHL